MMTFAPWATMQSIGQSVARVGSFGTVERRIACVPGTLSGKAPSRGASAAI